MFQRKVKFSFEPRTLEKKVINSFHTLFAYKASCTLGISVPEKATIKAEITHDPNLNIRADWQDLGGALLKTRNGRVGGGGGDHVLQIGVFQTKVGPYLVFIFTNNSLHSCFPAWIDRENIIFKPQFEIVKTDRLLVKPLKYSAKHQRKLHWSQTTFSPAFTQSFENRYHFDLVIRRPQNRSCLTSISDSVKFRPDSFRISVLCANEGM